MVEFKVKKDEYTTRINGDPTMIIAELAVGISAIYRGLERRFGTDDANFFKDGLLAALDPKGPAWDKRLNIVEIDMSKK